MLHIVIGVIKDCAGNVLISQRAQSAYLAGLWEFPGGKVERGESAKDALTRELNEELGIGVLTARPLIQISHRYDVERAVFLDVYLIESYEGEAFGREGQKICWVSLENLQNYVFPAANKGILAAICLPARYWITPNMDAEKILAVLPRCLAAGIRLVRLRCPVSQNLLHRCKALLQPFHAKVLLNQEAYAAGLRGDGVHLRQAELKRAERSSFSGLLAASCHNAAEICAANRLGCDFITLSPVQKTHTHPRQKPLGWSALGALTRKAKMPVYALGGLQDKDLVQAWQAGAQGVAGICEVGSTKIIK